MLIIGSCQTDTLIDDIETGQNIEISKRFPKRLTLEEYAKLIDTFKGNPSKSNIIEVKALNETESFIRYKKGTVQYYNYNQELQLFEAVDSFSGRLIDFEKYPKRLPSFEICSTESSIESLPGGLCTTTVTYHPFNIIQDVSVTITCGYEGSEASSTSWYPGGLASALVHCVI